MKGWILDGLTCKHDKGKIIELIEGNIGEHLMT